METAKVTDIAAQKENVASSPTDTSMLSTPLQSIDKEVVGSSIEDPRSPFNDDWQSQVGEQS